MSDTKFRVMIIDDEPDGPCEYYKQAVKGDSRYSESPDVRKNPDIDENALRDIDIILLDYDFGSGKDTGADVLQKIIYYNNQNGEINCRVILLSQLNDYKKWESGIDSLNKMGMADFIGKPTAKRCPELLKFRMDKEVDVLDQKNTIDAQKELIDGHWKVRKNVDFVGESKAIKDIKTLINDVAPTNANILITGESGTGKEIVAKKLHLQSERKEGPFVGENVAALAEKLIESELFGHEKGAFTDAHKRHLGLFEQANGGTIFLDEITELESHLQVKLLKVLQEKEIRRLGGTGTVPLNVRFLFATNSDCKKAMENGQLREDLYYRMQNINIRIPPLRERREDIVLLANYFLKKSNGEHKKNVVLIPDSTLEKLKLYGWPGNVRELENAISGAVILSKGDTLEFQHFPPEIQNADVAAKTLGTTKPGNQTSDRSIDLESVAKELIKDHEKAQRKFLEDYEKENLAYLKTNYPAKLKTASKSDKKKWNDLWERYLSNRAFTLKGRVYSPEQKIEIANNAIDLLRKKEGKVQTKWDFAMVLGMNLNDLNSVERSAGQKVKYRV